MRKADIVGDSKNEYGNRLTTMVVTFPRYILAEFNTHRMLSKNSASSRAIPFKKMIESVKTHPFIPMAWMKDHTGMQGNQFFMDNDTISDNESGENGWKISDHLDRMWLTGRDEAVKRVESIAEYGATKQIINRILEAYMYHTCIVTGTEWENFFALRCPQYEDYGMKFRSKNDCINYFIDNNLSDHLAIANKRSKLDWMIINKGMADIHMMDIAECMWDAYNNSTPKQLKAGQWHIPFESKISDLDGAYDMYRKECGIIVNNEQHDIGWEEFMVKISTMMCARVSYTTIGSDGTNWSCQKYIEKYNDLISANPIHASPLEHCAKAMDAYIPESIREYPMSYSPVRGEFEGSEWSGNFRGFIQLRKTLPNENVPQQLIK